MIPHSVGMRAPLSAWSGLCQEPPHTQGAPSTDFSGHASSSSLSQQAPGAPPTFLSCVRIQAPPHGEWGQCPTYERSDGLVRKMEMVGISRLVLGDGGLNVPTEGSPRSKCFLKYLFCFFSLQLTTAVHFPQSLNVEWTRPPHPNLLLFCSPINSSPQALVLANALGFTCLEVARSLHPGGHG